MIGELITAGAGLLGSLFGKKKQKTESTIDYVKMAEKAQEAGFNPLTALRNGGSAGFTSTVHHPGLSGVAESIGQIGGVLGSALEKRMDPIEQKRDQVESALLDYQLKAIQAGPKSPMMFGDVPTKKGLPLQISQRPGLSNGKAPGTFDDARFGKEIVPGDAPTASSMGWNKYGWYENPNMPDAGVAEQIHGEVLGSVYGGLKLAGDGLYSAGKVIRKLDADGKKKGPDGMTDAQRVYKNGGPLRDGLGRAINEVLPSWTPTDKQIVDWFSGSGKPKKGARVAPPSTW